MSEAPTPPEQKTETHPNSDESIGDIIKRLGPAAWLGIAWTIMPGVMGILLLTNMDPVAEKLDTLGFPQNLLMYIGIFVVTAGLGLLPTYSQAILAGFAFGIAWGFPAALLGFAGASVIGYFIANRVARKRVEQEIHNHPKAEIVRDAFIRHGYARALLILTLLRVPPNSPFALMNYVMSVSGVKLVPFLIATIVGMAPRTLAAVWIGSGIESWDDRETPKWIFITGIVLVLLILGILGKLANKAIEQAMKRGEIPDDQPHPPAEPPEKG